jgi:hypothetical protein
MLNRPRQALSSQPTAHRQQTGGAVSSCLRHGSSPPPAAALSATGSKRSIRLVLSLRQQIRAEGDGPRGPGAFVVVVMPLPWAPAGVRETEKVQYHLGQFSRPDDYLMSVVGLVR